MTLVTMIALEAELTSRWAIGVIASAGTSATWGRSG